MFHWYLLVDVKGVLSTIYLHIYMFHWYVYLQMCMVSCQLFVSIFICFTGTCTCRCVGCLVNYLSPYLYVSLVRVLVDVQGVLSTIYLHIYMFHWYVYLQMCMVSCQLFVSIFICFTGTCTFRCVGCPVNYLPPYLYASLVRTCRCVWCLVNYLSLYLYVSLVRGLVDVQGVLSTIYLHIYMLHWYVYLQMCMVSCQLFISIFICFTGTCTC